MSLFYRNGYWYLDWYYQGKRYQRRGHRSKREAEKMMAAMETDIQRGVFRLPPPQRETKESIRSFAELAVKFCNDYVEVNISHPRKYRSRVRQLLSSFKGKALAEIDSFAIEQYKKRRKDSGKKPASINRELACLKKMFNVACQWGLMTENPMRHVKSLREDNEMMKTLSREEESRLLDACGVAWNAKRQQFIPDPRIRHLKPIGILAVDTGMRLSEILTLRWSQMDWTEGIITLIKTKGNKKRILPMSHRVRETLEQWETGATDGYVFPGKVPDKPISEPKRSFTTACKRAAVQLRFHDLRHTFATRLLNKGVDIKTVQELLGHSNIAVTSRYLHSSLDAKKRAIAALHSDQSVIGPLMADLAPQAPSGSSLLYSDIYKNARP